MLPLNVMINVMIIGQPAITAIFRWRARLAWESTFTAMIYYNGSGVRELYFNLGDCKCVRVKLNRIRIFASCGCNVHYFFA